MAKAQVARAAAKRPKDKWKSKQWYTIQAPPMFNAVNIGETLAIESPHLEGRITEATMQDLTGDLSKMHIKCYFRVVSVTGTNCQTRFVGHELTSDYIRRLTRRKHSKIDGVYDVTTKDGFVLRVKPFAITERRAQAAQETMIRNLSQKVVQDLGHNLTMAEFVRDMINGELSAAIHRACKPVYPLKRVEIRKSEVRRRPDGDAPELLVFNQPQAEAPPEAAAAEGTNGAGSETAPAEPEQPRAEEELTEEERLDEPSGGEGA